MNPPTPTPLARIPVLGCDDSDGAIVNATKKRILRNFFSPIKHLQKRSAFIL
jgi:hypothetical protein